jgi:transposase
VKQAENEARKSMVEDEPRQRAKKQMMVLMQAGQPWQEAAQIAGVQTSRSTAYRWLQQFRTQGEAALHDGRHGHIAKMRKPIQEWLAARCRKAAKPAKLLSSERAEHPLHGAGQHHPS